METREKQAYLIEAHQCDEMLLTLLRMLDVPWNDIFIHMDEKNQEYRPERMEKYLKDAQVFHAPRINVVWGGVSQIKAELSLLKTAVAHGPYQHYHIISGVDLPIQTQEDIRRFFEERPDREFVSIDPEFKPCFEERVAYRHFFQNWDLRRHTVMSAVDKVLLAGQRILGLKRNRGVSFRKGSNWFSCTDGFARYLLEREDWILEVFDGTYCPDEIFVQTILAQSPYFEKIYHGAGGDSVRAIDWERGEPYVWRDEDLAELKASPCMFARKFEIRKTPELVQELERLYGNRE